MTPGLRRDQSTYSEWGRRGHSHMFFTSFDHRRTQVVAKETTSEWSKPNTEPKPIHFRLSNTGPRNETDSLAPPRLLFATNGRSPSGSCFRVLAEKVKCRRCLNGRAAPSLRWRDDCQKRPQAVRRKSLHSGMWQLGVECDPLQECSGRQTASGRSIAIRASASNSQNLACKQKKGNCWS